MKNLFIILICSILLVSCDTKLYEVIDTDNETTVKDIKLLELDSTTYKVLVNEDRFNVYSSDNKIVYKNCTSNIGNDIIFIPIGIIILLLLVIVMIISIILAGN